MFQMSFSKILASSLMLSNGEIVRSPRSFPTREIEQDRRYIQLKKFMEYYNINFDERKYWTYGCNCHILGDRPMSDPGYGPPVDRLDSVCKQYKDCNKCARERFGESCIGELVQYRYGQNVSVLGHNTFCEKYDQICTPAFWFQGRSLLLIAWFQSIRLPSFQSFDPPCKNFHIHRWLDRA